MLNTRVGLPDSMKIHTTVDNIKKGSLIYLLLPVYAMTNPDSTTLTQTVSILFIVVTFIRFLWMKFYPNRTNKKYLLGLYVLSGFLCLTVSALGSIIMLHHRDHAPVLFTTMLIATFTWGVMVSFSIEPVVSFVFGASILLPYTLVLAKQSNQTDGWIVLAGGFFLLWNQLHVLKTFRGQLKLVEYQNSLQFQDERLRWFINSLPGYVSWLDKDLNYIDANDKLVELIGIKREDLIGTKLGARNKGDALVERVFHFKDTDLNFEVSEISLKINGEEKHFLTTFVRHRQGSLSEQLSVLSLDVTSIKAKEQELEKKRQLLLAHERFTALGEIAGGIAHEINNPLAIIVGKADLLMKHRARGTLTDAILDRNLEGINNTSQRIARIINSLKILIRDGYIENLIETTVGSAIDPMIEIIEGRLQSMDVKFLFDKEKNDVFIYCGVVELGQVIMNLVINAAQAVEGLQERWVKLEVQLDSNKVYLIVSDSGNGISPEVQKKLFQPFFTTKAPGVGTGIGLSLSKELMQKQRGDLYYDPTKPHTTFVLELLRANGMEQAPPQSA